MTRRTQWLITVAFLVVPLLLALMLELPKWSARREWEACKKEALARGEKWSLMEMVPPPVPEEENFAMTPLLKPLFEPGGDAYQFQLSERLKLNPGKDGKGTPPRLANWQLGRKGEDLAKWAEYLGRPDVLTALKPFEPELAEIAQASRLPHSRFPLQYEKNIAMPIPMGSPMMNLGKLYALRAQAELAGGQSDKALEDAQVLFRLADTLKENPLLILHLVRISIWSQAVQVVWSGLEARQWSATQLLLLQKTLEKKTVLEAGEKALRSEQVVFHDLIDDYASGRNSAGFFRSIYGNRPLAPIQSASELVLGESLFYRNGVTLYHFYETYVWPSMDIKADRVFPRKAEDGDKEIRRHNEIFHFDAVILHAMGWSISGIVGRTAFTHTATDEAALACALERYYLEKGTYPDALSELVPGWIAQVPHDVIDGKPLRYRRTADGRYLIYSIGWNETDDGGKTVVQPNGSSVDLKDGDWVWSYEAR